MGTSLTEKYSQCIIWGAAPVYSGVKKYISEQDYIIAADGGWKSATSMGYRVAYAVGDFDSSKLPEQDEMEIIQLPSEKDDTDTHYALKLAISLGFKKICLIGVLGGFRMDHTIGAIQSALYAAEQGCQVSLTDGLCEMQILYGKTDIVLPARKKSYFSLFALGGTVSGVYEKGAKYCLENSTLTPNFPIGISNEFVGSDVHLGIGSGSALLVITPMDM